MEGPSLVNVQGRPVDHTKNAKNAETEAFCLRSALKTWASGVSLQSTLALAKAEASLAKEGALASAELKKPSKVSHTARENGSKTLFRRPPRMLGMSDMFENFKSK